MTNYLMSENGIRTTISDNLFDILWQSIDDEDKAFTTETEESTVPECEVKPKRKDKKTDNDVLNKKYKENCYFKDYYKKHDKPFECEKCGCKLNSSTNRARHQKSIKCIMREDETRQKKLEDMIIKKVIGISA